MFLVETNLSQGCVLTRELGAMKCIMRLTNGTEGRAIPCRQEQRNSRVLPDCVRLAERADTPELREKLLNLAREWMRAVMEDEDSDCAAQNGRPVVTTLRRDRRSQAARPPSPHSDEAPS
jgi:hypothetical protein